MEFLCALQQRFAACRQEMLIERKRRQRNFDLGHVTGPVFEIDRDRAGEMRPPLSDPALGPVMLAVPPESGFLSRGARSGASALIADFDDRLSPTWTNCLKGHASLRAALEMGDAVVSVRPRNWNLDEKHFPVSHLDKETPVSATLFDFGLSIFHIAGAMRARPIAAHFSLSKLEGRQEARLWTEMFRFAEQYLSIPRGFIRVMIAIDTVSAALEIEEILFELREYATALECSPVNYLSSFATSFRVQGESLLPRRSDITMNQPCLRAYQELLIHTCRKHQVRAISSSLQLPRAPQAPLNIEHEIELGFDAVCVDDADLVPAAITAFKQAAQRRCPQRHALGPCHITSRDLLSPSFGKITMTALRENVESVLEYLQAWLAGCQTSEIRSMASAELCRAQLAQWVRHSARLTCGRRVSRYVLECLIRDSLASIELRLESDRIHGLQIPYVSSNFSWFVHGRV